MSRFYRLSITEYASTLEVIVKHPGRLLEGEPDDVLNYRLNEAAADVVRQRVPSSKFLVMKTSPNFEP
jgi:hypothetical protein